MSPLDIQAAAVALVEAQQRARAQAHPTTTQRKEPVK